MKACKSTRTGAIVRLVPARENNPDWEIIEVDSNFRDVSDYIEGEVVKPVPVIEAKPKAKSKSKPKSKAKKKAKSKPKAQPKAAAAVMDLINDLET
jgi:hypothetical protein